jgi:hypothetical protein
LALVKNLAWEKLNEKVNQPASKKQKKTPQKKFSIPIYSIKVGIQKPIIFMFNKEHKNYFLKLAEHL